MNNFLIRFIILELRIKTVWVLNDVHYITSLLHPSFKNFRLNPHLKAKAIDLVRNEILKRQSSSSSSCSSTAIAPIVSTSVSDVQSLHSNSLLSKCFDLPIPAPNSLSTSSNELEEYLNLNVQLHEDDDILLFWRQNRSKFPILTSIVQDYYAIPASNTIVERLFSSSKNTVSDKRTRLSTDKINKLLFLKTNLSKLKSFDKILINEVDGTQLKRKTVEQLSSIPVQNEEQTITAASKKIKLVEDEEHDIVIFDEDSELDDGLDFF